MSNTEAAAAATPAVEPGGDTDERLAHRGPIQQLLTRPEIGALMGAAAVWLLFWLVSEPFGTVGGTANYLDVAAYLGLMAVPVALLMIGGEFDLSSGAMTGATAIVLVLLASDVAGAGLGLHLAVPLSLAFALAIGWFNGTLVEKTSLPSFIVTLGTFFILIGGKLGFSKLFTNKVLVEGLDEASGYDFWNGIFGASWLRNSHIWESRDWAWAGLLIVGAVAVLLGMFDLSYARRKESLNVRLGQWSAIVGVVAGCGRLRAVAGGGIGSCIGTGSEGFLAAAAGVLVGVAGWCLARYESAATAPRRGASRGAGGSTWSPGLAAALRLAMIIAAWLMNAERLLAAWASWAALVGKFRVRASVLPSSACLAVLAAMGRVTARLSR